MNYGDIREGRFHRRLNRFLAEVELDGRVRLAHVKNTGRCAELLEAGNRVYLEMRTPGTRKTDCDLVAVEKRTPDGPKLVNMDSMAPNRAAAEWLAAGGLGALEHLGPEVTVGDSRFDFCAEQAGRPVAVEVKGCTLEEGGVAHFPDAPTLRGLKHVRGLTRLAGEGWRCVLLVVIQMKGARVFRPNWQTQPEFGEALIEAQRAGVEIVAMDCAARPGEVVIDAPVRVEMGRIRN